MTAGAARKAGGRTMMTKSRMGTKIHRNWEFALMALIFTGLVPALAYPPAASAQQAKTKSPAGPSMRTQRVDPMTQTQGSADQKADDQILVYRFRLDTDSVGSQLIVTNTTDSEGTIALFAQDADGTITKEIKRTIEPGAVFAISAADAGWSPSNVVSVKASRRLLLSLQLPGEPKATEIVREASTLVYDVFGFERQSELAPSGKKRGLSLLYSDRRFSRELSPEASPQQGTSELLETSGSAPARGLFVLQSTR
jgi:hypothetical protein